MDRLTKIYVLKDPRNGTVRYVGKTISSLTQRLAGHICDARHEAHRNARWIMALASEGLRPEIVLIEQAGSDWAAREGHWIAHYRAAGANLNNHSDGGEGAPGVRASTKAIANRAARMKALWTDPDFRERQRQRLVERNRNGPRPRWTEERRNAIREGNARRWTPEARKENGVRTAARNKTMKVKWTDERRAKQSEVAQRVNADPARKAKQSALMTRLNRERRRST